MAVRISIITICYNNINELQRTCHSVDTQHLAPYEHFIIDGSTSKAIYEWLTTTPQPSYRKWLHENDEGIADAFNKGIKGSNGDVLYLLNSGDELYDSTVLGRVTEVFVQQPLTTWCHGKMLRMRGGVWVVSGKPFEKEKLHRGMRSVFHPTMYVRRAVYESRGLFDTSLQVAMDYDLLCRIADEPFCFIDYPLARFDPTGISSTSYLKGMQEFNQQYCKHFGPSPKQRLWYWRQTILSSLLKSGFGQWLYRIKVRFGGENW